MHNAARPLRSWSGHLAVTQYLMISLALVALCCATARAQRFNHTSTGNTAVIDDYYGRDPDVVIPETIYGKTVVGIRERAFANRIDLVRIRIPRTVSSIGKDAFLGCSSLTSIMVDEGNQTFQSTDGVLVDFRGGTIVHHPEGRSGSFTIPDSVTALGVEGFVRARGLSQVTIGENVHTIDPRVFDGCSALTAISVSPSNPKFSDQQGVLYNKSHSQLIRFPRDKTGPWTVSEFVSSIPDSAFNGCSRLTAINVSPGNPAYSSLDGVLFDKSQLVLIQFPGGKAGTFVVPANVQDIRSKALQECGALTAIDVAPDSSYASIDGVLYDKYVTEVLQCPGGKTGTFTLPDSVQQLRRSAFLGCSKLTALRLNAPSIGPVSVAYTFSVCASLTEVSVAPTNPTIASQDGLLYNKDHTTLIWCPPGRTGEISIPDSTTMIWPEPFLNCTRLTRIVFGDGMAFDFPISVQDCSALESVVLGAKYLTPPEVLRDFFYKNLRLTAVEVSPAHPTLSSLDGMVYSKDFTRLHFCPPGKTGQVTIADLTTNIDYSAFSESTQLTRVVLGQSQELLPEQWNLYFDNCPRLAAIDVPTGNAVYSSVDGVVYNKDQTAILWCPPGKTGEIIIPDTVTTIDYRPFSIRNQVSRIVIGNGVRTIEGGAFFGCTELTSIVLGSNVILATEIIADYFINHRRLASIEVAPAHPTLGSVDGVLYSKDLTNFIWCPPGRVGELVILDSVKSLEFSNLYGCTLLTQVDLGHGVSKISSEFFFGCIGLTRVAIGNGLIDTDSKWWQRQFATNPLLAAIEVAPLNTAFSSVDGVLYDKTQTTLLHFPRGQFGRLVVPETVVSLEAGAFDGALGVTSIYFEGPAPTTIGDALNGAMFATVYYLADSEGWGAALGGRPTAIWEPAVDDLSVGWDPVTREFGFAIHWAGDRSVVVEACSDLTLANWSTVATVSLVDGDAMFRDPASITIGARFYRVRRP